MTDIYGVMNVLVFVLSSILAVSVYMWIAIVNGNYNYNDADVSFPEVFFLAVVFAGVYLWLRFGPGNADR